MKKPRLKIAIISDGYTVDIWKYSIIETIHDSFYAEINLLILNECLRSGGKISSDLNKSRAIIASSHIRLDEAIFGKKTSYKLKSDLRVLIKEVPEIRIKISGSKLIDISEETFITEINKYHPDVILNFGSVNFEGAILKLSKYGIWSYHHGDSRANIGGPPGYWEVCQNRGIIGSELQMQCCESDEKKILYCSWSQIKNPSIALTRNSLYWKSALFVPRVLKNLYNLGDIYFNDLIRKFNSDFEFNDKLPYSFPDNMIAIKNFFIHLKSIFRYVVFSKLFYNYSWLILLNTNTNTNTNTNSNSNTYPSLSLNEFKKLVPPKGKFWADPFVITQDNRHFIFVEELIYKTWKGHISVIILDENGQFLEIKEVLNKHYHLSYPFIFKNENIYYMIPETSGNHTIELYRCKEFPDKWEFVMNLMEDVSAVDTTLFYYENMWWLFTNIDETNGKVNSSDELFLFFSKNLFSDKWERHPKNPIISDSKFARPAGNVFTYNDKIYRPSQNNSGIYGRAFNINQILKLSKTEYIEDPVSVIEPKWDKNIKGTHTFNFNDNITVIDGFYYQRKLF
jgi:hypothetical protein